MTKKCLNYTSVTLNVSSLFLCKTLNFLFQMCPILQLLHNHAQPATVPKRHNTLNNLTYSASKVERLFV